LGRFPWSSRFFREADHEEASEDNDDGLVDMDDDEDKEADDFGFHCFGLDFWKVPMPAPVPPPREWQS